MTPNITLNLGLRYTYPGVLGASDGPLTNFLPEQGMVSTENLYPADKKDFSPRIGVAWTPWEDKKTVIRGAYGIFYDLFAVNFFTANTSFSNGGALGVGNNPGGDDAGRSRSRSGGSPTPTASRSSGARRSRRTAPSRSARISSCRMSRTST